MSKIEWAKARCPICGREYEYPANGYKPPTCSQYECVHKYLHPELRGGANSIPGSGLIARTERRKS
jgi:hypothetical protein